MADRTVSYTFTGNFTSLLGGLTASGRAVQDFGGKLTALDRQGAQMRAGLEHFGRVGGQVALGLGIGLAATAKAAVDWESAWAGVQKTVDGSAKEMAELEAGLRSLARTMPATHEEIAATAEAAGQLGVAREDIVDFTKVMLQLGETTNLSADQAATSIAQFFNVMGTAGDQVDEFGATLVDLGNKGASTEAEILTMAQRLSGAGALVGASEQDVLGLASAMANLGVQAELGGGAVQRVFIGINTAVSDGGDSLNEFAQVAGVSADEFAAKWKSSPVEAFDLLLAGLNGVQASGGNVTAVLEDLGIKGTQNLQVMLRLAGAGDELTNSLETSRDAWSDNTALTTEYGKRAETTGAQVRVAWNNIKDAAIETGAVLLPIVAKAADGIADLAGAFNSLPGPAKSALTGLAGITAIFGGGLWFTSKVIGGIANTKKALQDLGIQAGTTQTALASLGKATSLAAILTLLPQIEKAVDDLFGSFDIEDATGLGRDLATLLNTGEAVGQIENLDSWIRILDDNLAEVSDGLSSLFPGDSSLHEAEESLRLIDQELANMVESGRLDDAAALMGEIEKRASELGTSANQLPQIFTEYAQALDNANEPRRRQAILDFVRDTAAAALGGSEANDKYAGSIEGTADASRDAVKELNGLVRAMREQTSAALGAFDATTAWGQAVADARRQAKSGEKGLDALTEAGRNNRNALSQLAGTWNEQPAAVKNSQDAYRNARKTFIEVAAAMGVGEEKAKRLADRLLEVPRKTVANVEVNTGDSENKVKRVKSLLDGLHDKSITLTTYLATIKDPTRQAQGGYIAGPGTSTSDSIPAMLSNGEFVMRAAAVQRYGIDAMYAMNEMKLAAGGLVNMTHAKRFAGGGGVGGQGSGPELFNNITDIRDRQRATSGVVDVLERERRERIRQLREQVRAADKLRDVAKENLDAAKDFRDGIRDAAKSLSDSIASKFGPSPDMLTEGATLGSLTADLVRQGNLAGSFASITKQLEALGLDGPALQWLLENASLLQLHQFANEGADALDAFEAQFNATNQGAQLAGQAAANARFGEELANANRELRIANEKADRADRRAERVEKLLQRVEENWPKEIGEEVGKEVNGAMVNGRNGRAPQ